jgi:hypothetical protein
MIKFMKRIIKYNYFWFGLALLVALIFGCRCITSKPALDPLAGWKSIGFGSPNKAITDDYQGFIENLKPKNSNLYVTETDFYEDGTGQHAVKLTMETNPRVYVEYILIYDKSNVRTKVIKGNTLHQFHI